MANSSYHRAAFVYSNAKQIWTIKNIVTKLSIVNSEYLKIKLIYFIFLKKKKKTKNL